MSNETNDKEVNETNDEKKPWVSPSATIEQVSDATRAGLGAISDGLACMS